VHIYGKVTKISQRLVTNLRYFLDSHDLAYQMQIVQLHTYSVQGIMPTSSRYVVLYTALLINYAKYIILEVNVTFAFV